MFIVLLIILLGIILYFIFRKKDEVIKNETVAFQLYQDNTLITNMTLTTLQASVITVNPIDRNGNLSEIQPGSLTITSSNPAVFTVEPFGSTFKAVGQSVGTAKLIVKGDADSGTPIKTITTEVDVIVTAELAVGFNIVFSPPLDK